MHVWITNSLKVASSACLSYLYTKKSPIAYQSLCTPTLHFSLSVKKTKTKPTQMLKRQPQSLLLFFSFAFDAPKVMRRLKGQDQNDSESQRQQPFMITDLIKTLNFSHSWLLWSRLILIHLYHVNGQIKNRNKHESAWLLSNDTFWGVVRVSSSDYKRR